MSQLLQVLANGIVLGSIFSLVALGYSIVFSSTRNFHYIYGGIIVTSGVIFFGFTNLARWGVLPAALVSVTGAALVGWLANTLLYEPLLHRNAGLLTLFIAALGAYLILENVIALLFGTRVLVIGGPVGELMRRPIRLGPVHLTFSQVGIFFAAMILIAATFLFFRKTKAGLAVRALDSDAEVAEAVGIHVRRVRSTIFTVSSLLAGAAGILVALDLGAVDPYQGPDLLFTSIVAVIIGGIGNITAAAAGGFIIGILQSAIAFWLKAELTVAILFTLLVAIMLVRPTGLLGRRVNAVGR